MIAAKLFVLMLAGVVPAFVGASLQDPPAPPPHDSGCSGCEAKNSVDLQKWTNPNGHGYGWEGGGGSLDVSTLTNKKKRNGRCKKTPVDGEEPSKECEKDPDYPCEASGEVTINAISTFSYICGKAWSGPQAWASATAAQKTLTTDATGCNVTSEDWVSASNDNDCVNGPNDQRVFLKSECTACVFSAP
jgi:hypothetical protein